MSRVLLTLLALVGVLGSPIMREVCLLDCASPDHHAGQPQPHEGTAADHACHESGTSSSPALNAVPHGCEHDSPDPISTSVTAATDGRCAPAVPWLVPTLAVVALERSSDVGWSRGREPGPPQFRRSDIPLPLRI